jgi:hypothetical protein
MSFLVDMAKVQLNESGPTWIQGFPLGTWHHPAHGEIKITPERVKRFAEGVANRVRGQDLNIDYDHQTGEAAGWVRAAEDRGNDGLWLNVDFTPTARQQLSEKKYRYFSPEYQDEWESPVSKQKFTDVLFGGALTNRPFLKGIVPINLSEAFAEALKGDPVGQPPTPPTPPAPTPPTNTPPAPAPVMLTEDQLKEMPFIKTLMEQNKTLTDTVKTLGEAHKLSEAKSQLSTLNQPTNGHALSSAVLDQAAVMLADPSKAALGITTILQAVRDGNALVPVGETGGQRTRHEDPDAIKQFMELVTKYQTDHKCDYAMAAAAVQRENVQLAERYSNAVMAKEN